ncbi:mechanosensitive ion channel domain-containing protein [Enterobacteriaceae endosymbiont of Donacia semicuprea]|uniref:mechanosensitive ion channel domain-containing protein n=1 Tax=Enterobacteriaceae endosymbiont of Donacia semicuprea TaxID=2675783 RepID=UPI001449434E|nr:mechanosensitive ion channel domain-containing protein [Enterobacteriaceae endosymbiont of Donacia semicuprea]QJC32808.1 mechanosensitive ion channel [Enterobacteriaceae endosymbiont of Donacia semicuprea]
MSKFTSVLDFIKLWIINNKIFIFYQFEHFFLAGMILFFGLWGVKIITKTIKNIFTIRNIDPITIGFLSNILKYSLTIFVIVSALSSIGLQTSSIFAAFGTIGLVVGLAWQSALANLASGLLIITFRIFKVGDYINIGNVTGKITNVEIFCTLFKTFDGTIISVPNGKILTENIINFSKANEYRNKITLGVSRNLIQEDINIIKKILLDTISINNKIIKNSIVNVIIDEITNNSINFTIFFWINDFRNKKEICSDLINILKNNLELYKKSCVLWIHND